MEKYTLIKIKLLREQIKYIRTYKSIVCREFMVVSLHVGLNYKGEEVRVSYFMLFRPFHYNTIQADPCVIYSQQTGLNSSPERSP